jgi:hypothetical protein
MADDSNFRSYRPADQRWPARPAAGSREEGPDGNDPLAELARLIGQSEPLGDLNKDAPRPSPTQSRPTPAAMPPVRPAPASSPSQADPYGSPLQFGGQQFGGYTEPQQEPAYDPAIYGAPQQEQASAHPPEAYYDDPSLRPQGEEAYQDDYEEERPRRGLKLALVVAGLAIIGTSGVFGYRAIFSGGPSGPPPVIKASTTPTKVVPAPTAEASNKQIYDRVGEGSQGERIVSREEKPVEVKDHSRSPARVASTGLSPSSGAQDTAMAASPPLNTDPGGPASAEPRKIRTVTIRPDQTSDTGSTPAPRPTAARAAAAASVPPVAAPAPPPARAVSGNGPLSLNPQVASADASARPAFPPPPAASPAAAAPTRVAAVPPAAEAKPAAYSVQISSQRSETEAQASFRSLQGKFPNLLGDRQPMIRRADLGEKGIYFRTMVGPFASADQAKEFCGSLKSAGGQCVVQRN